MNPQLRNRILIFVGVFVVALAFLYPTTRIAIGKLTGSNFSYDAENSKWFSKPISLGLDLSDDSLNGTPNRVAKMFVNEIFGGLDPEAKPNASKCLQNKIVNETNEYKTLRFILKRKLIDTTF